MKIKTNTSWLFVMTIFAGITAGTVNSNAARVFANLIGFPTGVSSGFPIVAGRGYRWTAGAGIEYLQPPSTNYPYCEAQGISADGKTIVGYCWAPGVDRACSWDANLQPNDLGFNGEANAASADGSVIVGVSFYNNGDYPVSWSAGNIISLSDNFFFQNGGGVANGISADGRVIVGQLNGSDAQGNSMAEAVEWQNGQPIGLGYLPGIVQTNRTQHPDGIAVSGDGEIIAGYAEVDDWSPYTFGQQDHVFWWTSTNGMTDITPADYNIGTPISMSADARIIVGSYNSGSAGPAHPAMIWTAESGWMSIEDYVVSLGGPSWPYGAPSAMDYISADGRWVVGYCYAGVGGGPAFFVDLFTPTATNSTPEALAAATGSSNLVWSTLSDSTNSPWASQSYITHDGVVALENGHSGNQSVLQATVTGPGALTFWWRVSSSANASNFTFSISGNIQKAISGGDSGWMKESFAIPAGTQTLTWVYTNGIGGGIDSGWLDDVSFTRLNQTGLGLPFRSGDVAALRVQDNSGVLTNVSAELFIDEYNTNGTIVQSILIPTNGPNSLVASGEAVAEAALTRSPNGRWLCFTGYHAPIGVTNIPASSSAQYAREIATLDVFGNFKIASANTNFFNTLSVRGGVSDGTNNFWSVGALSGGAGGGLNYHGFDSPSSLIYSLNLRTVNLFNGKLYLGTASGGGIYQFSGYPKSAATPTRIIATGSGSPYAFTINPSGNVAYIADDDQSSIGGIQRWTNSSGIWSLAYTLGTGTVNTGARGLAVDWSGASSIIYASTSENSIYGNPGNRLIRIVDTGPSSPAITLATTSTNCSFRGMAFVPQANGPQSQIQGVMSINADAFICWAGQGGSNYVVQATTNLAIPFNDLSPSINLGGSGIVPTNYLDPGALTNFPGKFYRIRSN